MQPQSLKAYIETRISELDQKWDEQEFALRGRFNFGVNKNIFGRLPSWGPFVQSKKRLVRLIWIEAFCLVLIVYAWAPGTWALAADGWWKGLLAMAGAVVFLTLMYSAIMLFSLAFEVAKVQRHVKKLLYEDLLHQIAQEEAHSKSATVKTMGETEKIA